MSANRIRVVHIINSFEFGGAEAMLCNLLLHTDRSRFDASVVTLIDDMSVAKPIIDAGFSITTMGMNAAAPDPRVVNKLAAHLRKLRPDVVQTWMDHSNLIGGVAARLAGVPHVVWGIHHSAHIPGIAKRSTLMTVKACALLSRRLASRIVCCSEHSRTLYGQGGFAADKLLFIPNGFDTTRFRPDESARANVRQELGLDSDALLIGLIARYDPFKDHANFLNAASLLVERMPQARFVLCGSKVDWNNAELVAKVKSLGLADHCHLLGPRMDIPRICAALDVAASSSVSEAFPLAVGEAMSAGVPCVATDVGDSALIIGSTGRIVPARNPYELAEAMFQLLTMPVGARRHLGERARRRVKELFDLSAITRKYETLYTDLVTGRIAAEAAPAIPRRVLMVVESSAGGTGRHVLDLCEGLIQRGSEVHLIHSTIRIDRFFTDRLAKIHGLRRLGLPIQTGLHPSDLTVARTIRQYLDDHGPFDVIHGHSSKGGALARLGALGSGVPAFYTLHGLIMMDPGLSWFKRAFYLSLELLLSLRTSKIIAVSPEEARAAVRLKLGNFRIATVPNGLGQMDLTPRHEARKAIGVGDDAIVIGFVGRLVDQKAPHVLIEAFARAAASAPQARLALVGAGPLDAPMREFASRLGVAEKIIWLGERDARGVLSGFDLFAISSRKEGLPYVVLEAMGAGLPVVATASSGVEILVDPGVNGEVVPRDDVDRFAAALTQIITNPARLARYAAAARYRASLFTVDAMVDRTLAVYASAATAEPRPVRRSPGRRAIVLNPRFSMEAQL